MKRFLGLFGALALVCTCVDTAECGYPGGCGPNGCNCNQCNPGVLARFFHGLGFADDCDPGCRNGMCGHGGCFPGNGGCFGGHCGHLGGGGHFGGGLCGRNSGYGGPMGAGYVAGPPTPTVVYPYYTTRGPRDFLDPNPRGIGP
jgi:hypothetical protein